LEELDCFFYPESVAVIGASNQPKSIGKALLENFFSTRLAIKVFPVNPNHATILGKKAFPSVKSIPAKVDLAIVAVPAKAVPMVLRECIEKKVGGAIIISAGFAEIGEKKLTAEIQKIISKNPGTRVIGPNCFGVYNSFNGLNSTFSESRKMGYPKKGKVAFISQSGALGVALLDWISSQEFGLSKFVSYGNAMDVDESDLVEYFKRDKQTKVLAMYIEGVKKGRKFFKVARETSLRMPIVALKGGMNKETHNATASHTGSLAGSVEVYEALFRQTGIIQAYDLIDLFSFAKTLENEPLPKGNRVLIITNGGGYGIVTADQVVGNCLKLAGFSRGNEKLLRKAFPRTVTVSNPLDLVGDADDKRYKQAILAGLREKKIDILLVLILFNTPAIDKKIVKELIEIKKKAKKPLLVVTIGSEYTIERSRELERGGVIVFKYPSVAAKSIKALVDYAEFRRQNH